MATVTVPQNSFKYRMGASFPGDVNRTHPASVEPVLNDPTLPLLFAGLACLINAAKTGVRQFAAGDTAVTKIYGVGVRAFPIQQQVADGVWGYQQQGLQSLPAGTPIDVLRDGYIMGLVNGTPGKNDPVFVWCAASSGAHVQGGFEQNTSGGNTAAVTNAFFNGPPDANGYGEVVVNID